MILAKRERYVAIAAAAIVSALVLDRFALTPYLDRSARLTTEKRSIVDELARAHNLFERRKEMAPQWEQMMKDGLKTDAPSAENAVLTALRNWAEESGLTLTSLKPERSIQRGQLREITFQAVCVGPMSGMSRFLWKIENAALPVKLNELQLATRKEGSDDLSLQVRVAALCIAPPAATPGPAATGKQPTVEEPKQ